jgi:hypothetical protein
MRVVSCHQIARSKKAWHRAIVTVKEGVPTVVSADFTLWVDESVPLSEDWAISAEWRRDASDGWKPLDRQCLSLKTPTSFEIDFRHIPKKHVFDFFRQAQTRFKLRYLDTSANGLSWYNAIWIAAENMHQGVRTASDKTQTIIHETGHFVGMVPAGQSTQYTGHDHTGPHCSTGLSAADVASPTYKGLSGTCVMFGESAVSRHGTFCSVCDPSVRTRKVVLMSMPSSW